MEDSTATVPIARADVEALYVIGGSLYGYLLGVTSLETLVSMLMAVGLEGPKDLKDLMLRLEPHVDFTPSNPLLGIPKPLGE